MPVILFIIDNSASMNQSTYLGTSFLDLAKGAIENFIKVEFNFGIILFLLFLLMFLIRKDSKQGPNKFPK